jgi:hypothetical protein
MKKIILLSILTAFLFIQGSFAQRTLTGTILSADDGQPLPGVNIRLKGNPNIGTISDYNGNYTLTVPDSSSVLVFEFLGMNSEEKSIIYNAIYNLAFMLWNK